MELEYRTDPQIVYADALLSTGKVRSRLDPAVIAHKGIERHHIFPRNYLRSVLGMKDIKQVNQIANMALVEWSDNIDISDDAPAEYWPAQLAKKHGQLSGEALARQVFWHALPDGWQHMDYPTFLAQRRLLMAQVTRDAFAKLADVHYQPTYPEPSSPEEHDKAGSWTNYGVRVSDLLAAGLLPVGATLIPSRRDVDGAATVTDDGRIEVDGEIYDTPSSAGHALRGSAVNGWTFWLADTPSGQRSLAKLRDVLLTNEDDDSSSE